MLRECLPAAVIRGSAFLVAGMFLWIVGEVLFHGLGQLSWTFLTAAPEEAGRAGGIGPILVSTGAILAVCMGVSLPLGLGTAVFLSEYTRRESFFGRLVRTSLDVLAGVPSIVFGLFGYAFFSTALGMGFSILSGGLTLAGMVLPILIRSTEAGFRAAPEHLRLGAAALGFSRAGTLFHLLLPAAAPGLVVGLILGVGRALAETAALLFTSGAVMRMPGSLFDSGRALSVHIFDLSMNVPGGEPNAYGTAVVLLGILLVINSLASGLGERWLKRRILEP